MIIGIESAPSQRLTPNHSWFSQMMTAETSGTPTKLTQRGSSMCFTQSSPAFLRLKMPPNADSRSLGFAKSPNMEAVTIMETPHQRHHDCVSHARPKTACAMS